MAGKLLAVKSLENAMENIFHKQRSANTLTVLKGRNIPESNNR